MDDQPHHPRTADEAGEGPDPRSTGASRWMVILVIVIAIALLGLLVFLHLSGAIGPGIHDGG